MSFVFVLCIFLYKKPYKHFDCDYVLIREMRKRQIDIATKTVEQNSNLHAWQHSSIRWRHL